MRILFIRSIGKNKYGGGERWVTNSAYGLHKKGHFVVVAGKKDSILLHESIKRGVYTYSIGIKSDLDLFKAYKLSRFIKKNKIDVVICKARELVVSSIAAKWGNRPLVIRRSGAFPSKNRIKWIVRTKLFVDGVITNTKTIKDVYKSYGFDNKNFIKVIYNGYTFDDSVPAYDFKAEYPSKFIILAIGRVVKLKGYYYLINALSQIKNSHPEVLVYVLGDGKEKRKLVKYAEKKGVSGMICFAGYTHQVIPYIKGADMFIHTSLSEGMPNAAMEAMAYGKPVVMTRVNGAEELSDNGKYALLIPTKNPEEITESIKKVMFDPDKYNAMGEKAKQFVRFKFSMDNMINSLEKFLEYHLNKKQAGN